MIKVITVTTDLNATKPLLSSLKANGWDFECIHTAEQFGFGTKVIMTYNYLVEHPEVDQFIFVDAFDVIALSNQEEFENKLNPNSEMIFSSERGCWPNDNYRDIYPNKFEHGFNFLNSGLYYSTAKAFIEMVNQYPLDNSTDDQAYFTDKYLFADKNIELDNGCQLFQSYSFIQEDDFGYEKGRLKNYKTSSMPVWVHGNGRTDMRKIYELAKLI